MSLEKIDCARLDTAVSAAFGAGDMAVELGTGKEISAAQVRVTICTHPTSRIDRPWPSANSLGGQGYPARYAAGLVPSWSTVVVVGKGCTTTSRRVRQSARDMAGHPVGVWSVDAPGIRGQFSAGGVGDLQLVRRARDGDATFVMQPMVVRTEQYEIGDKSLIRPSPVGSFGLKGFHREPTVFWCCGPGYGVCSGSVNRL